MNDKTKWTQYHTEYWQWKPDRVCPLQMLNNYKIKIIVLKNEK